MQYTYPNMPCATPQSSDCVLYVGKELATIKTDPTCLTNLTEVVYKLDETLDKINKEIDLDKIKGCLSIDVTKASVADYLQALTSKLCVISEDIKVLKAAQAPDLLSTPIQIDLSCLGSSCDNTSSSTLLTVIATLVQEICTLKQQSNNNNDYYQS